MEALNPATFKRTVAVFDYDNTLVNGDSLWPFLLAAAGWRRAAAALLKALLSLFPASVCGGVGDYRTFIKQRLLISLLRGKRLEELKPAVEKMRRWPRVKKGQMDALLKHHAAGHLVVIASGSLDIYLHALLEKIPHHAVICTEMEVKDGVLTGLMSSGNCVRAKKAERVAAWLALNGPFENSYGYGNAPHDLPMLHLLKHEAVV
jgi:phosphatidylglycerophosphatase C